MIFNGSCSSCTLLAKQAKEFSNGLVNVIPFSTESAQKMLANFYPHGAPFDYYLIETNSGNSVCRKGNRAMLRLPKYVGYHGTLKMLETYLHYRSHSTTVGDKIVATAHQKSHEGALIDNRRTFMRILLAGGIAIAVAKTGILAIQSSAQSSVVGNGSKALPLLKNSGSISLYAKEKIHEANVAAKAAGLPPPTSIHIPNVPDCIYQCPCSSYYCVACQDDVCWCCCMDGCGMNCNCCGFPDCTICLNVSTCET
jgi:hypothetical protein